jgi:DNA mismatch repair protein MutS
MESWIFDEAYATENLLKHFHTHSLKGYGVEELHQGVVAAGAVLHYLKDTEHPNLQHITSLQRIDREDHLWMDRFTIRNLELTGGDGNNLLKVLDNTVSPMGARLLKRWLLLPLKDISRIHERLQLVSFFIKEVELRNKLLYHIKQCGDIERLVSKIPMKKINPREVLQIARGLQHIEEIKQLCASANEDYLKRLTGSLDCCSFISEKIRNEIADNPPAMVAKGGVINASIHAELDQLRKIATGGKEYLVELQNKEAGETGISSLKIGFNNVFGYYL